MSDVFVKKVTVEYATADGTKRFRVDFPDPRSIRAIVFNAADLHTVNVGLFAEKLPLVPNVLDASRPITASQARATSEQMQGGDSSAAGHLGLWWYTGGGWFHPET